jgi:dihydrodipicolinate synthase/N-acetylneuraminate lyase
VFSSENIKGVIAFTPTVFTDSGLLDEDHNRENFHRLIDVGAHGLQILGSSAEFFSVSLAEHETMVRLLAEEVGRVSRHVITICGCGAQSLSDAIARARIAREHGMDAGLFVLPHYFPLDSEGAVLYFEQIAAALPDFPIMHYNTVNAKTILTAHDYSKMKHVETMIGTKQVNRTGPQWRDLVEHAGHLNHMDCDDSFLYSFMNGATAVDLLIVAMRPRLAMKLYELCAAGDFQAALPLQQYVWDIMRQANYGFVEGHGYSDCTCDKALVEACGFLHGGDPRPPYVPMSSQHKAQLKQLLDKFPDV